jgi:hypothetical protein
MKVTLKPGFVIKGYAGWVPLPRTIIHARNYKPNLRFVAHELMHVHQWHKYGWAFPLVYAYHWVIAGFSYWNNALEVEARAAENDEHYIEWARVILTEYNKRCGIMP